jgi:hypothetical protein
MTTHGRPLPLAKIAACAVAVAKTQASMAPLKEAAWAAGIPARTFMRWWVRGREAHEAWQDAEDKAPGKRHRESKDDKVLRELYERIREQRGIATVGCFAATVAS